MNNIEIEILHATLRQGFSSLEESGFNSLNIASTAIILGFALLRKELSDEQYIDCIERLYDDIQPIKRVLH
jgi:hypothetical protein